MGECNKDIDRISILPDAIICHILSFIPTKLSVQTRILSKRWKQLFTFVPVLDFSFGPNKVDPDAIRRFVNFVTWVFSCYNVNKMDRFCYYYNDKSSPITHSWISESIRRGVRELDVTVFSSPRPALPSCRFTCKTLANLKIRGLLNLEIPVDVCLPRVKTLHLLDVTFPDDCSVARILQSCPVLENLSFSFLHLNNVKVCVPTLKRLKIKHPARCFDIELDVPSLECFKYSAGFQENCSFTVVHDFKLLDKACFDFWIYCCRTDKVVNMVSHVRHLCFFTHTLTAFEENKCFSPPIFHNVTHLDIRDISVFCYPLAVQILNMTPRLEVLLIKCAYHPFRDVDRQLLPKDVPTCVSLHLKKIEIFGFSMLKYKWKLVTYFLKNAKHLCMLKLMSNDSVEMQSKMSKKLRTLSKCSTAYVRLLFSTPT